MMRSRLVGVEIRIQALWRALVLLIVVAAQGAVAAGTRDPNEHFFQGFLGDLKAELDNAKREDKKGIVLVYEMEECPFCERFHRSVANRPDVQEYYRRNFLVYRMDIRGGATITGFDGMEGKESEFAAKSRVRATPTTVFYGLEGQELARFSGLPRDSAEFLLLGRFVVEGHYRTRPFAEFKKMAAP